MDNGPIHASMPCRCQRILPALLLIFLTGCASLPEQPALSQNDLAWALAGADHPPPDSSLPILESPASLLQISEAMRRFAQDAIRNQATIDGKTRALAAALQARDGLGLRYDSEATLSAEQAFIQRRANCLSYTLLFVALAREAGIPAKFNDVAIPPIWELGDDSTLLLYRHINARIDVSPSQYQIVDVSSEDYSPRFDQQIVSDQAALAQFYNNRAVELRLQQRTGEALRYQLRSLELEPDAGFLWANLSSLYLLDGRLNAASIAITRALALEPRNASSFSTAADIHSRLGNDRLAAYFRERAQTYLDQNPYYHFQLALSALKAQDELRAYREARQAILLNASDPRFFFLAAELLKRFGDLEHSGEIMRIALQLTPDPDQQARYRSKFGRLNAQG